MKTNNPHVHMSADSLPKISHDLKTPITIIQSSTALLRMKISTGANPEEYIHCIRYIEQNCQRLILLINSILTNPCGQTDPSTIAFIPTDLGPFLDRAVPELYLLVSHRNIELQYNNNLTSPCPVKLNTNYMDRILMNLISNSAKHTPSGGVIAISVYADKEGVYLTISDTGEGYSQEVASVGNGLGLSIVKELTELHGGTFCISGSPGAGTFSSLSLPRFKDSQGTNPPGQ